MLHHRENHVGPDHKDQVLSNMAHNPPSGSNFMAQESQINHIQPHTTPSSGLTTRLLPYKNARGEIEWAFTEDLAAYRHAQQASESSYPYAPMLLPEDDFDVELNDDDINIGNDSAAPAPHLPRLSNQDSSSNMQPYRNHAHQQAHPGRQLQQGHQVQQGQVQFLNQNLLAKPASSRNQAIENRASSSPLHHHDPIHHPGAVKAEVKSTTGQTPPTCGFTPVPTDDNIFKCPECLVVFKIRGYLTRHMKLHSEKKAYMCPFNIGGPEASPDKDAGTRCRHNGGFARRDTYKTHLKSRHFAYPQGIKNKDRLRSLGWCSMCGLKFPNAEIWAELHIEGHECLFLPHMFHGRSRFRENLIKNLTDSQREAIQRNGGVFPPEMYWQVALKLSLGSEEPLKDALGGEDSPAAETPTSDTPNSPAHMRREGSTPSDAPPFESCFREIARDFGSDMPPLNMHHASALDFQNPAEQQQQVSGLEDFGDAFCLDTDQINTVLIPNQNNGSHNAWGVSPHIEGPPSPFPQDLLALFAQNVGLPMPNDSTYGIPSANNLSASLLDASLEQFRLDPEFPYDEQSSIHPQNVMQMDYSQYPDGFH